MALGDLAAVKIHVGTTGRVAQSALGMQCISPALDWRALLAAEFRSLIMPEWLACLSWNVYLLNITVTDVLPGTGLDAITTPSVPIPGDYAGVESPANAAYVVSWRSDGAGRNTRGRNYLFGLPRDWISNATYWSGDAYDAIQNLVEVILAQYGPTGFSDLARLQVISRGPHDAPLAEPQAFPITHAVFGNAIRTMRKRIRTSD